MDKTLLAILAGTIVTAAPAWLARRSPYRGWIQWLGLALGGLVLLLGGVEISLFNRPILDLPLTLAWMVVVGGALGRISGPPGLKEGLAATASTGYLALALVHGQTLAVGLAAAALTASLGLVWQARVAQRQNHEVLGWALAFVVASIGVILAFPGRPPLSTWLVPVMPAGIPLANLALLILAWVGKRLPLTPLQTLSAQNEQGGLAPIAALMPRCGWPPRWAAPTLWACGLLLAGAAVIVSRLQPFHASVFTVLAGLACVLVLRAPDIRKAGWLPFLIFAYASAILLLFILSLHDDFLDFIFVGALSGYQGWDYFQLPRAFDCLSKGYNLYRMREPACAYGPWATPYLLHPMASVVPGAFLRALSPWLGYSVFVAFQGSVMLGLAWAYARQTPNYLTRSLIFLTLAASWPLYLMLWMGQSQVFVLLSFGLITLGLLQQPAGLSRRASILLAAGLLGGMLTKPLMAPFVLVLLIAPETRRLAIGCLIVYALISAVWVLHPALSPTPSPISTVLDGTVGLRRYLLDNANLAHWGIVTFGQPGRGLPNNREIMALTAILRVLLPTVAVAPLLRALQLALLAYPAWAVLTAPSGIPRILQLRFAAIITALSYLVVYGHVFEYHYAALAAVPAVFLLMLAEVRDAQLRRYLRWGLIAYIPFLLPSIFALVVPNATRDSYFDFSRETLAQMTVYRTFRVLPAVLMTMFTLLCMGRVRLMAKAAPLSAGHPSSLAAASPAGSSHT